MFSIIIIIIDVYNFKNQPIMKHTKILLAVILICFFTACTSETETDANQDTKNELKKIEEVQPTVDFRLLAKSTDKKLNELLISEGYNGIFDSKLVLGTFENNELVINSKKVREILSLYFKLVAQEANYDVDYNSFEYLIAKDNNGHSMLISRGVCKVKGEIVSIGINIIENQNRVPQLSDGLTTVVCSGCDVGCSPRRTPSGDGWCTNCVSLGTCTKTETLGG